MSVEATSALTFNDLILEVALKMGVAYYGVNGDAPASIPIDTHDLAEAKRHVNDALRMFISDAPPSGWRWTKPVADITLWPSIVVDAAKTVVGGAHVPADDYTPVTANSAVFFPSMEEKEIVVTGQGTFTVKQYISSTVVHVYGNHTFVASTYSIAANGDYTLPRTFAGALGGTPTFLSQTNRAAMLEWTHEVTIRQLRENNSTSSISIPRLLAIDVFLPAFSVPPASARRRYKLMAYPTPDQVFIIQLPYDLHFDELTSGAEVPPTPIMHDESLRAACRAIVEKDVDEVSGPDMAYYVKCLDNSIRVDSRSGPRKLGYFGNGPRHGWYGWNIRNFRDFMYVRPNVIYNP